MRASVSTESWIFRQKSRILAPETSPKSPTGFRFVSVCADSRSFESFYSRCVHRFRNGQLCVGFRARAAVPILGNFAASLRSKVPKSPPQTCTLNPHVRPPTAVHTHGRIRRQAGAGPAQPGPVAQPGQNPEICFFQQGKRLFAPRKSPLNWTRLDAEICSPGGFLNLPPKIAF